MGSISSASINPESQHIFCNNRGQLYGGIKKSWLTAVNKFGIVDFHFRDLIIAIYLRIIRSAL